MRNALRISFIWHCGDWQEQKKQRNRPPELLVVIIPHLLWKRQYFLELVIPLTYVPLLSPCFLVPFSFSPSMKKDMWLHSGKISRNKAKSPHSSVVPPSEAGKKLTVLWAGEGKWSDHREILTGTLLFVVGEWEECLRTPVMSLQGIDAGCFGVRCLE